ncbi:MAG: class I SAM-dependent rRNA methyltransferase [Planctomycetota bacterium]|jgi:23S rRNA (cytosine1962-C5)-methyltransferase
MSNQIDQQQDSQQRRTPWVELRSAAYKTFIFRKMVKASSPDARPGDCVAVYDRRNQMFGHGLFNPESNIAVRMLSFDGSPIDESFWKARVSRAVRLRDHQLRLADRTDAYRVIHAEGDNLSGLVVDKFADVLSISVYSLGMWNLREEWLPILLAATGARHYRIQADRNVQQMEAFTAEPIRSEQLPGSITIRENDVRFTVEFDIGHKTGFFCDQRDNRERLATMCNGADVIDLCSFSGGFGVYAKTLGQAGTVRCVDLDEDAVALIKRNANLNQVRVDAVHSDVFIYMRQMMANARTFDVVVLDPPKLIAGRKDVESGLIKYRDMNRLACGLVSEGGLLLTCSCSGALSREEFVTMTLAAVRHAGRKCQVLDITGPGLDHPVSPDCPESSYLKAVWLRLD